MVVEESNLYSTQKSGASMNTLNNEVEIFIGMHMKMGIIKLLSYKLYWSQKLRYPAIANQMSLKRFEKLRSNLHFVHNNRLEENAPKLAKVSYN